MSTAIRVAMPEERTRQRARKDKAQGKAPSTQAGEFVREELDHVREGKHGARSAKQAIAIGLSKARRSGVDLPPPKAGAASERTRKSAARETARATSGTANKSPSKQRSRAAKRALEREGSTAASKTALSRQAHAAAPLEGARGTQSCGSQGGCHAPSYRLQAVARASAL